MIGQKKYVIGEDGDFVICANQIAHRSIARSLKSQPVGAGFLSFEDGQVSVWGLSESLGGLKSRGLTDAKFFADVFHLEIHPDMIKV